MLRDLEEGFLPIGFGKSRGLGEVRARVTAFKVRYVGQFDSSLPNPMQTLYSVGALAGVEREAYGLQENDTVMLENTDALDGEELLGIRIVFGDAVRCEAFRKCVNERWRERVHNDRS